MSSSDLARYWDQRFELFGHTGFKNIYAHLYDQRQRIGAVLRALESVGVNLNTSSRILDLGCGSGDFSEQFAVRGAQVLGVDISAPLIAKTRERFKNNPKVVLETSPLQDFLIPEKQFDLILSVTVLQHVTSDSELESVVKRIVSGLRDGGTVLILESVGDDHDETSADYLTTRSARFWRELFTSKGLNQVAETAHPQLLLATLKAIHRAVGSDRAKPDETPSKAPGLSGKGNRREVINQLLGLIAPLDRIACRWLPISNFDHRIFVFQKQ